jgi:hypothetical protein
MAVPISKRKISGSQPPHLSTENGDEFLNQEFEAAKEAENQVLATTEIIKSDHSSSQKQIPKLSDRDKVIEEKIMKLSPLSQVTFRAAYDRRHIVNVMTVECEKCADFNPPQTYYHNLSHIALKLLHDAIPDIRDRLEEVKEEVQIMQGEKRAKSDPQKFMDEFFTKLFKEHIK